MTLTVAEIAVILARMPELAPQLRERIMAALYQHIRENTRG